MIVYKAGARGILFYDDQMINCYKPDRNEQNCWSTKYDKSECDNSGCVDATDELGSGRQGYYLGI